MFAMVDYLIKGDDFNNKKSCKCGEYESFERLLFMFYVQEQCDPLNESMYDLRGF